MGGTTAKDGEKKANRGFPGVSERRIVKGGLLLQLPSPIQIERGPVGFLHSAKPGSDLKSQGGVCGPFMLLSRRKKKTMSLGYRKRGGPRRPPFRIRGRKEEGEGALDCLSREKKRRGRMASSIEKNPGQHE